jgi:fucose 4-O-acetylase-like acetyltransferase
VSAWSRALALAEQTPPSRNRYVDFLRALSIGAVILGHWIIAAPWIKDGRLQLDHMLAVQPATQWLTLLFQVMPVFFLVGGYSNAASWDAARRSGRSYGTWVAGRARRLIGPIIPLILVWAAMAFVFRRFGVGYEMIRHASILALVPMWFLAVYLLVVLLVPVTRAAWHRYGTRSLWVLVALAVAVDVLRFHDGHRPALGWINYLFVWGAVHQLGYLWRDGRLAGTRQALPWLAGGALAWVLLAWFGPYPLSMVGVPGEPVSNTTPPSLLLLAFAAAQVGLVLALEGPMRRWLDGTRAWAATVLVNGTIMTVYLWHLTVLALLVGVAMLAGGFGLHLVPGTAEWWLARVPWLLVMATGLGLLIPLVGRFERSAPLPQDFRPSAPRVLAGAALASAGIAFLALDGIAAAGALGVRGVVVTGTILGAWMLGAIGTGASRVRST